MAESGCVSLHSRRRGRGSGLRIRLGNADVSAYRVLSSLVDDDFLGQTRSRGVEEDRLVDGAVLLLEALVLNDHGDVNLILLFVYALEFYGDVANLLRLVFATDGKLDVVALAEAA